MKKELYIFFLFLASAEILAAQETNYSTDPDFQLTGAISDTNNSVFLKIPFLIARYNCKNPVYVYVMEAMTTSSAPSHGYVKSKRKNLSVSGSVLYDLSYRSWLDTPFAAKDLFQHTLQTRLNFLYKEKYPFHLNITTRFSNNQLFRKYFDVNYNYSAADLTRIAKGTVQALLQQELSHRVRQYDSLLNTLLATKAEMLQLKDELESPNRDWLLLSKREEAYWQKVSDERNAAFQPNKEEEFSPDIDWRALQHRRKQLVDTSKRRIEEIKSSFYAAGTTHISSLQTRKDSLTRTLDSLESRYNRMVAAEKKIVDSARYLVAQAKDMTELSRLVHVFHLSDSCLPKAYRFLGAINTFAIGRATADYSELTVRNLSITGIQVEYNPGYYFAVAAGKVDFRYRDYMINRNQEPRQSIALVRFGKGFKTGNHIYFTYYTGRRQLFNSGSTFPNNITTPVIVPGYQLAGISLAGQWKINRFTVVNAEWAKSTVPYFRLDSAQKSNWMQTLLKSRNGQNSAVAVRFSGFFQKSDTRFTGSLRYTGAGFQSFSLINNSSSALAWSARLEQRIKGNRFKAIAGIQQNDFQNPYIQQRFSSSSLQATVQMTWRAKKGLTLMAGYYPSYQLVKLGQDDYGLTRYQTLIGTVSNTYKIGGLQMSSMLMISRFFNESADSGFVYFNSRNIFFSQQFFLHKLTLGTAYQLSRNLDYSISSIEQTVSLELSHLLSISGGAKLHWGTWNGGVRMGYNAGMQWRLGRLGEIQLQAEKGFLPGLNRTLMDNNMGRLIYTQNF